MVTAVSERTSGAVNVTIACPLLSVTVLTDVWFETEAVERLPAFVFQEIVLSASGLPLASLRVAVRVSESPEINENDDGKMLREVSIFSSDGGNDTEMFCEILSVAPSLSVTVRVTV